MNKFQEINLIIDELNKNRLTNKYNFNDAKNDIIILSQILDIDISEKEVSYRYEGTTIIENYFYSVNHCKYGYNNNYEHLNLNKIETPIIKNKMIKLMDKYRNYFYKRYKEGINILI